MRNDVRKIALLPVLCLLTAPAALPWGQTGHRIIAEVASQLLNASARKKIEKLLGNESLAQISNWADFIRQDSSQPEEYNAWHVIHFPQGTDFERAPRNPKGDVLYALERLEKILRDKNADTNRKTEALKLYVHFAADLHNPLHTGYDEDGGGNSIRLTWFRAEISLHYLWDDVLIKHQDLSYREYVSFLPHPTKQDLADWTAGSYVDWMKESRAYLPQAYQLTQDKKWEYVYNYTHVGFLNRRLLQAGVRLAHKLNDFFK